MGEQLLIPGANDYSTITTATKTCGNTATKKSTCNQSSSTTERTSSKNSMIQATAARVSDKPSAPEQQAVLKCPRCDSSNTKFCYYNNYSLSQPRHFCKACKRYWTRGGTLRNVPVGGGCRKNKRVKKPAATSASSTATGAVSGVTNNLHPLLSGNPMASLSNQPTATSASHIDASLLYALRTSSAMSLTLPGLGSGAHIPSSVTTAFDLQSQLSALGLEFSAKCNDEYQLGHQLQQLPLVNSEMLPPLMADGSINSAACHLVSSLKHSRKAENYQCLLPYEDLAASGMDFGMFKDVKSDGKQCANSINSSNCSDKYQWQIPSEISTSTMGAFGSGAVNCFNASAADSFYQLSWNTAAGGGGGWPDIANYGSSVTPPLI